MAPATEVCVSLPLAWVGLWMALGALSWPWWRPGADSLLPAVLALVVAAALGRSSPVAAAFWMMAAFALGAASVDVHRAATGGDDAHVLGTIVSSSGSEALLERAGRRLTLRFSGPAPPEGTRLAALTVEAGAGTRLPGSWPEEAADQLMNRPVRKVRQWIPLGGEPTSPAFPEARHAGLMRALATGRREDLPEDERDLLRRTGTSHLLSVSGLHVALVAGGAGGLAALLVAPLALLRWPRLTRLLSGGAALAAACAYADLVGWPVSARRAVWMVGAAVVARAMGRSGRTWSALGLAATAVVLFDPGQVAEPPALLSFGAVAGILWVGPRITRWLPPDSPWILRYPVSALATTVGATAGTLPITAWIFQSLPPLAPLSNLVAVPLIGGVGTPAALLAALLPAPWCSAAAWVGDQAIDLGLRALRHLDVPPWHPAVGPVGAGLLALALPLRRHTALVAGLVLLALGLREVPAGGLTVTWLSVGQGDAALVRWPDGRAWLLDGGPGADAVTSWLRREGVRRLDAVILSHPDMDHLNGLQEVIDEIPTRGLWVPREARPDEETYGHFLALARERSVPLRGAEDPLPGALILEPPGDSDNDGGLVVLIGYKSRMILFTGDIEAGAERWLIGRLPPVDVVKVPHHGSRTSSTRAFVDALHPALAVISVGVGNPFGHPAPEVVDRWPHVLRTDQDGTIQLWLTAKESRLSAWRPGEGWRALGSLEGLRMGHGGSLLGVRHGPIDTIAPGG